MATAKITIHLFSVECPHCKSLVVNPSRDSGTYDFEPGDVLPKTIKCEECGKKMTLPKIVR